MRPRAPVDMHAPSWRAGYDAGSAAMHASTRELANVLHDLLDMIAVDNLIPESVSYMQRARAALAKVHP